MRGAMIKQRAERRPGGFTLVELLTALGIIGLLVSLLLPAVMAGRASARRAQCTDHLRQLAVACASYESARGAFPITTVGATVSGGLVRSISPQALLLPYLEMSAIFSRINFDENGTVSGGQPVSTVNAQLLTQTVPVFLCPDDHAYTGGNNYRANMGVIPSPGIIVGSSTPGLPTEASTGAFRINRALSPAAFTDGLANTVMFSEKLLGGLNPTRFDPPRDSFYSPYQIETVDDAVLGCQNPPAANPPHDAYCGTTWLFGGFDQTWYNHIFAPNASTPDCASNMAGGHGAYTARSFHARGVNAAFADGSVRAINENVDLAVWRAIATRTGGEVTASNF
jgi:prepilin-type N-terminal cleavage/methylation domain-containing protein/prepilin-type processing-associated H-X9-DG protein